jgi:hypothetical protein
MSDSGSMQVDDWRRSLIRDTRKIQRLQLSMVKLERDVEAMRPGRGRIHFCIDFFDLREYLSLNISFGGHGDRVGTRRVGEDRVTALLFNFLPSSPFLLPPHYKEFVSFVKSLLADFGGIAGKRQELLENLRRSWRREMEGSGGLLARLEEMSRYGKDESAILEVSGRIERILLELDRMVKRVAGAVTILERFDFLHRTKRLRGWADLIGKNAFPPIKEDSIFYKTLELLSSDVNRRESANHEDARALGLIRLFNEARRPDGEELFLVTGVDAMRRTVEILNETVLTRVNERIELRDLEYWTLWFNALSQSEESRERIPDLKVVRDFRNSLSEPLREALQAGAEALGVIRRSRSKNEMLRHYDQVEGALATINRFFEKIYEPILDGRVLLAELYRGFEPVYEERALSESVNKIRDLLESMKSPAADFSELGRELLHASRDLDALAGKISEHIGNAVVRIGAQAEEFRLALYWDPEPMAEPYRTYSERLDSGMASSEELEAVIREMDAMGGEGLGPNFSRCLVQIRALLALGRIEDAFSALEDVNRVDRMRPAVRLLEAVLRIERRELMVAERILSELEGSYRDPGIKLALARVRLLLFGETGEVTYLDAARLIIELVLVRGDIGEFVRVSALEIRAQSELLRPARLRRHSVLFEFEKELVDILARKEIGGESQKIVDLLASIREGLKYK